MHYGGESEPCIMRGRALWYHKLRCHCVNTYPLREHACVSSRGAQSTELVWILDFKQILLLLLLLFIIIIIIIIIYGS